ncbi:MAG: ABC transporter ATP-binding protein [Ruminococcus sp.]|nr:ABC transporter ATP-binding protein [Ruminococcus sp.]MCM1155830.1 ABC transporter ATP-binding protein [Roseburia sp.]
MDTLTLEHVSYRYKKADKNVLKDVNCHFSSGEMAAVIGPSGSGKTTFLSILAGLDVPTSGTILKDGQNVLGMDRDLWRRREVAVIFQSFQLFPRLTVLENAMFPLELNGIPKKEAAQQAKANLKSVGLDEEKFKRYPANLSGGEQQRVAIARSLSSGARILLADEPTGNLDEENTKNIISIFMNLAHELGYCIIVVTHDPDIAAVSDVVWKMTDGELVHYEAVQA